MSLEIDEIFDSFDKNSIFKDKSLLQINYKPENIIHRTDQIKQLASILAPVFSLFPINLAGKTLVLFNTKASPSLK